MANNLVGQFQAAIAAMYGALLPIAQNLFVLLAAISITWSLIWWIVERDDPVPIFVSLLQNLMRISFFWFVLANALTLGQALISSFRLAGQAAATAAGGPTASLDPTAVISTGATLADQLLANISVAGVLGTLAGALIGAVLALLLFLAFLLVAAQMAIALVEIFILLGGGVLLLGFLGSPWTARFGLSVFSALIGGGAKLFMIYVIVGIGSSLVAGWSAFLAAGVTLMGAFTVLGVAAIFALATWMIPNYAQALASGAVSTSLNSAVSSAAGIAATATGARVPMAIGARTTAAMSQGVVLAHARRIGGASRIRAFGAGLGHTVASPFGAAASNLAQKHSYRRRGAAEWIRAKR